MYHLVCPVVSQQSKEDQRTKTLAQIIDGQDLLHNQS